MFSEGTGANEREVSVSATKIVLSPLSTIDSPCLLPHEAALAPVMRMLSS